ncbi:hypothetical protein [Natrinema thermotolerans]
MWGRRTDWVADNSKTEGGFRWTLVGSKVENELENVSGEITFQMDPCGVEGTGGSSSSR